MGMTILQAKQRLHEMWMQLTEDGTDEKTMQALCIANTVLGNYEDALKADMVAMLNDIKARALIHHSKFDDDKDLEVDRAIEDIVLYVDAEINKRGGNDGNDD